VPALGATPGATRTNNFKGIRTHLDSGQGGVRGRGLTRTSADTNSGIYGCPVASACPLRARSAGQRRELTVTPGQADTPADLRTGRLTRCANRPPKQ
jgi:hypothetical protein